MRSVDSVTVADRYNGRQALQFDAGAGLNGALYDGGLGLLPINTDLSVIIVGRQGIADTGYIWGNGLLPATAGSIAKQWGGGGGLNAMAVTMSGTNVVNSGGIAPGAISFAAGPVIDLTSLADSTDGVSQQMSPGGFTQTAAIASALHVTNAEFHLGDIGPAASALSAANYIEGGDVAEVLIVSAALHLPANAVLLGQVQAYLRTLYGIAA